MEICLTFFFLTVIGISYYSYEFDAIFRVVGNRFGVRRARAGDKRTVAN